MGSLPVTNEERDLVFEIAQGHRELILLIGHIRMICLDAKQVDYMEILRWLNRNGLKGYALKAWMVEKQRNSVLQAIAYVRARIYSRHSKVQKLFAKHPL